MRRLKNALLGNVLFTAITIVSVGDLAAEDATPQHVLFNRKLFADMGDTVHVEGQVTGEGIGYKVNRYAMTCYRDRSECILTHVDTHGWQAFSIGPPLFFNILKWEKDLIIADLPGLKMPSGHPCGGNPSGTTWYIHRDTKITVIQENYCSLTTGQRGFYEWTIEGRSILVYDDIQGLTAIIIPREPITPSPRRRAILGRSSLQLAKDARATFPRGGTAPIGSLSQLRVQRAVEGGDNL